MSIIAVTGGAGFVGSSIVRRLVQFGHEVRVVDTEKALERLADLTGIERVSADLRDPEAALHALEGVTNCIALAARSAGIAFFNEHPAEMLSDNTRITANTFEAARIHAMTRLVYVSSSCVFDNCEASTAREDLLLSCAPARTGYPFSKLIGEYYCQAYWMQFGLVYSIVRPFNVYGPGEGPGRHWGESHVIPDLVAKILGGQYPLEIFGDGQQTRSFTYVEDVADGIITVLKSDMAVNEDFNLGFPCETSILSLAERLWTICGRDEPMELECLPTYPIDVRRRAVDITKAETMLSWEPRVNLDDGLQRYVSWYRKAIG